MRAMTAPKAQRKATPKKKASRAKPGTSRQAAAVRRKTFIEAFLANGENGLQAALAAGFAPNSAGVTACKLLKDPRVASELEVRRAQVLEKAGLTTERVLQSIADALFFDPRKLYREDGSMKPIIELDDSTAQALAAFEVFEEFGSIGSDKEPQAHGGSLTRHQRGLIGYTKKVKWLDKNTAREQALKHFGLFGKDNSQRVDPLIALLADIQKTRSAVPIVTEDPVA